MAATFTERAEIARHTSGPSSTFDAQKSAVNAILTYIIKDEDLEKWSRSTSFDVLWVAAHDFRSWTRLYGPWGAVAIVMFGNKSVWKTQVEVLNSPHQLESLGDPRAGADLNGSGEDDGSRGPWSPGAGDSPGNHWGSGGDDSFCDHAAREFKEIVQIESSRVALSGALITTVAITALGLPKLSQAHWVARAFWISSLVTALLAVYNAGNLVWKLGCLFSANQIRAWIRGSDKKFLDIIYEEIGISMLRLLTPALSSVLIVSAPGLLLSAAILFLLLGFGIYLGFVWTRALDTDAGRGDSRDVFIVYLVVLVVCYVVYTLFDIVHDRKIDVTVRGTIVRTLKELQTEWPKFLERNRREQEMRELSQFDTCKRILGLEHPSTLISMYNLAVIWKEQGLDAKAIGMMEDCMDMRERVLGRDHPHVKSCHSALRRWGARRADVSTRR